MSQALPEKIDIQSLNLPILLVEQETGSHFVHLLHNREATGIVLNLRHASELNVLLNNPLPVSPNSSLDVNGLCQIDTYFDTLGIPLCTTDGWHDQGWVSVEVRSSLNKQWRNLEAYAGSYAILIWNVGKERVS
jgi:hypothetical protein